MRGNSGFRACRTTASVMLFVVMAAVTGADAQQQLRDESLLTVPSPAGAHQSVFDLFDELARAAARGGRTEIERFVDICLVRSIAYPVGASVRTRVAKAEVAYRARMQRAITDADVVNAINRGATRYAAPGFVRTNDAQVALLRHRLGEIMPHLGDLAGGTARGRITRGISPAHATFLVTFLITQKLENGAYQMDADAWVHETRRHMKVVEEARAPVRQQSHPQLWSLPLSIRAVMSEPPSDTNMFTVAMHRVLDDLGLAR